MLNYKVNDLIIYIKKLLSWLPSSEPRELIAWWLLEAATKKNRTKILAKENIKITSEQKATLDRWIFQITKEHKPLAYILGDVSFCDLKIFVTPPILIPRPETEEWAFNLTQQIKNHGQKQFKILDIGTGSGCIALTLAKLVPKAKVTGIDISIRAIELSKKNAKFNKIKNATFLKSDLFEILENEKFDLIVSNPPYIDQDVWANLSQQIKEWEDPGALIAKNKGLKIIEQIVVNAPKYLHSSKNNLPSLVLEIGYDQGNITKEFFKKAGFEAIEIKKDLAGKDRVVIGRI